MGKIIIKVDYVITGGIAVSSWGNPRATRDLDVIVVLIPEDVDEFCKNLQEIGFSVDKEGIKEALREKTHFSIFDEYSEYHIDGIENIDFKDKKVDKEALIEALKHPLDV